MCVPQAFGSILICVEGKDLYIYKQYLYYSPLYFFKCYISLNLKLSNFSVLASGLACLHPTALVLQEGISTPVFLCECWEYGVKKMESDK